MTAPAESEDAEPAEKDEHRESAGQVVKRVALAMRMEVQYGTYRDTIPERRRRLEIMIVELEKSEKNKNSWPEPRPLCPTHNVPAEPTTFSIRGEEVRGWKCGEGDYSLAFRPDAEEMANRLAKARAGVLASDRTEQSASSGG